MPDAVIVAIADLVVAELNAATLSQPFTAERAYVPVHDLADLDTLRVTVVPRSTSLVAQTRVTDQYQYQVDVAVQVRTGRAVADVDPYMLLAEEVVGMFNDRHLHGDYSAYCTDAANDPVYAPDHLDGQGVFTSVITLSFVKDRRIP